MMSYVCNENFVMKTNKPKPLLERIKTRIIRKKGNVFLREDFSDLGGYDQVGRAMKKLTEEGVICRLGYGVYARGYYNRYAKKILPVEGVVTVRRAVERLGVTILPSPNLMRMNADGVQVPNGRVIGVNKRFTRKLGYDTFQIVYKFVSVPRT